MKTRKGFARVVATALGVAAVSLALAGALSSASPAAAGAPVGTTAASGTARLTVTLAPAYTAPTRTLRYGMSGSDVKALQQRLAALKYYPGTVDGTFGAYTLEAVWAFQEVQGLRVDGVVGPATGSALVHRIGNVAVLYRARAALPRILIPDR